MQSRISATAAARKFSDLLNRVRYRGEEFIVERGGEAVARIGPVAPRPCTARELIDVLRSLPPVDGGFARDVASAIRRQGKLPRPPWAR